MKISNIINLECETSSLFQPWLRKLKWHIYLLLPNIYGALTFRTKIFWWRKQTRCARASTPSHGSEYRNYSTARKAAPGRPRSRCIYRGLTWRPFPLQRQDAVRRDVFSASRVPIQAPRTRVASLRGISIIRCRPTRSASMRSQHRHAQSHNYPGVSDFEDFSLSRVPPFTLSKMDELTTIDERSVALWDEWPSVFLTIRFTDMTIN